MTTKRDIEKDQIHGERKKTVKKNPDRRKGNQIGEREKRDSEKPSNFFTKTDLSMIYSVGLLKINQKNTSDLNLIDHLYESMFELVFLFLNSKCKRYFRNRLRPAKLTWTAMYMKQHKKDVVAEAVKKVRKATKNPYPRSIVCATLEVIQKRRADKAEVRDAAR